MQYSDVPYPLTHNLWVLWMIYSFILIAFVFEMYLLIRWIIRVVRFLRRELGSG